jgi:hypothetical protein
MSRRSEYYRGWDDGFLTCAGTTFAALAMLGWMPALTRACRRLAGRIKPKGHSA